MKTFKQTYVIVKLNDNTYDFFKEDYISFDLFYLDLYNKCDHYYILMAV